MNETWSEKDDRRFRKADAKAGRADGHGKEARTEGTAGQSRRAKKGRDKVPWMDKLICGDRGPVACEANVVLALREDAAFVGRLRFNELAQAVECGSMPWRACDGWRQWTDLDDYNLAVWMQHRAVMVKDTACAKAVQIVAAEHPCHPVRDYLDACAERWDGTRRLDSWLTVYLGVTADPGQEEYLRQVGRCWPVSAVARVYKPGAKADCALILEGLQGKLKSSAIAALCPREEWFTDQISDLGTKDSSQDLVGKWLVELPELSAMGRADIKQVKAYLSRRVDHYRASYGRRAGDYPRQAVFAGTTNESAYLGDATGNRRFWPVKVGRVDLEALQSDRDQLWGEAVHAFRAGEQWWLTTEAELAAVQEQDARRVEDVWEASIIEWAETRTGGFSLSDALAYAVGVPLDRQDRSAQMRAAAALKAHGWQRVQRDRKWVYLKPTVGAEDGVGAGVGDEKDERKQGLHQPHQPHQPVSESMNEPPHAYDTSQKKVGWVGEVGDEAPATGQPTKDPRDEPGWLDRLRAARTHDQRNEVIRAWTEAAGGRPGVRGEVLVSELPLPFLGCTIANLARRYGWDVRGIGR